MKEKELESKLVKNLEIIEQGLRLIERQKRINKGVIDLFCKDRDNNYVIVEIKKEPTINVITQLAKYNMVLIKNGISVRKLRTILVAQEIPGDVKEICEFFKFEIKNLYEGKMIRKKSKKVEHRTSASIEFFRGNPFVKVMDFLIGNYIFDYTKTEVAQEVGISRMTIESIWQSMIKEKIIIKTKKIGNATLYRLNTKNPIVIKMRELDLVLANKIYAKEEVPISVAA